MAPSHYLSQCWVIVSKVQWHSWEGNLQKLPQPSITKINLKIPNIKSYSNPPWVNKLISWHPIDQQVAENFNNPVWWQNSGPLWPMLVCRHRLFIITSPHHHYQWWQSQLAATLTHWGQVMHIFVGKLTIICSDNGLSPGWCQAIIWTTAGILSIRILRNKLQWNNNQNSLSSCNKIHLKMLSAKCRPFSLSLNVLTHWGRDKTDAISHTTSSSAFS